MKTSSIISAENSTLDRIRRPAEILKKSSLLPRVIFTARGGLCIRDDRQAPDERLSSISPGLACGRRVEDPGADFANRLWVRWVDSFRTAKFAPS